LVVTIHALAVVARSTSNAMVASLNRDLMR